jgi:colicin import membrane protein
MALIKGIESEVKAFVPNTKSQKGREEIASLAYKVSKSKKPLEAAIKAAIADKEEIVKKAKAVSKLSQLELDRIRDEARDPLNKWEAEQKEIDEKRKEAIKLRIAEISALSVYSDQDTKEEIGNRIEAIENIEIEESFEEFAQEALKALKDGTAALNARVLQIIEEEQLKEQREQMEAQNKLIEEQERKAKLQERLNKLSQMPLEYMTKSAQDIKKKIEDLTSYEPSEEVFSDLLEQAKASKANVVAQLGSLLIMAEAKEKVEFELASKQREEEAKLLAKQEQERAWNDAASYALAQLTSEEVQDVLNWFERQSMHSGDAVYDKCLHDVREHYHARIKSEAEIQQKKKEAQASQTKAYVENTAVGVKPAPEVPAPEVVKTTQAPIECLEYRAIELVVNRAYEWGIASDKVDALTEELKQLLGV